ncbi:MAG: hypothetical protein HY842_04635 [Bacteroidetes bacterium]|nr:hypothetical protein [Bacteroidota bacterium]
MLHLLGIRHHGPGSSRAVLKALEAHPPDCLLVEAPADAQGLLTIYDLRFTIAEADTPNRQSLLPPVSMLIYDPKDLGKASYLPFAEFSPEWQAICFALSHDIPVRFMDLPMELSFALDEMERQNPQASLDFFPEGTSEKTAPEERQFRIDPMAHLARLAGYADSERWWEVMFENPDHETDIFAATHQMVAALREGVEESSRTLQREAHMRQTIRQAAKDGFQNIAIVCGAWHVPTLHGFEKIKASHDAALLKGIKKIKTTATWIPWSYDRLTFQSGYRSGVISPAWYELLFSEKKEAATHWMINVARLFRAEDLDASSAHVIEGIRLAETLATLRGLAVPGIDELKEAAVTTICEGDGERLQLIENKLITGNKVGSVPDNVPVVPLQRDIEQAVKSARLTKHWETTDEEWLGATAANPQGGIDLREEPGRLKSHLLHRLNLLDIPWGKLVELNRHQSAGGFKEFWKMKWSPEFAIRIIEMGAWGNTLEEACVNFLTKKTAETSALPALTSLVKLTLNANLPAAFGSLLHKLENLAALTTDVYHLMDALPPLAQIVRYGNTRGTDIEAVEQVVRHLVPRICIGLPAAVHHLDEDASKEAFDKLLAVNRALGLLNEATYFGQWFDSLHNIADNAHVNGILAGACTRILFDKKIFSEAETATRMRFALSRASPPLAAAQWLEGFLQGSGLLLLHNSALWNLLDEWVGELGEENFSDVLPLLRRTFSRFPPPERERMLDLAKQGQVGAASPQVVDYDEDRAVVVLPMVRLLVGSR